MSESPFVVIEHITTITYIRTYKTKTFYILTGPIRVAWNEDNCHNAVLASMEMSLYVSSDIFLFLSYPPVFITSVFTTFINVPLLHLCPFLSAVQCWSSHSACLQAVFLVSPSYSRHFLLFFFNTTCPVNCTLPN